MRILVIAPHPDDETLGCGGTLLKHKAQGDEISWLVVTEGYEPQWSPAELTRKAKEVEHVRRAYGMSEIFKLGHPSARLDMHPQADLIGDIRHALEAAKPQIVYLVHGGDVHTDHQATFSASISALKPFHMRRMGVRRVLSYETLSSTEAGTPSCHRPFLSTIFSDITQFIDRKLEIMALYQSEIHEDPMPRGPSAIRALARLRGAMIGVDCAEAFMPIREVF